MILHVLIAMVAGWLQRHQQQVITSLLEENRICKAQLGGRRLCLTDTERRRQSAGRGNRSAPVRPFARSRTVVEHPARRRLRSRSR